MKDNFESAVQFALDAHKGQLDKGWTPYIQHVTIMDVTKRILIGVLSVLIAVEIWAAYAVYNLPTYVQHEERHQGKAQWVQSPEDNYETRFDYACPDGELIGWTYNSKGSSHWKTFINKKSSDDRSWDKIDTDYASKTQAMIAVENFVVQHDSCGK